MKNSALWEKINRIDLDEVDAVLPFSKRLMRENNWKGSYARNVVQEYKRFVYLAATSEKSVTPSDEVDQVWHLHLVYTRHYWGDFTNIIGKPIHHGPTKGGSVEGQRYREQYRYTLERYREEFSCAPPRDIWPDEQRRFSNCQQFMRLNTADFWIVRKPKISMKWIAVAISGFSIATIFTTNIAVAQLSQNSRPKVTTSDLIGMAVLFLSILGLYFWVRSKNKKKDENNNGGCGGGGLGCGGCGG